MRDSQWEETEQDYKFSLPSLKKEEEKAISFDLLASQRHSPKALRFYFSNHISHFLPLRSLRWMGRVKNKVRFVSRVEKRGW